MHKKTYQRGGNQMVDQHQCDGRPDQDMAAEFRYAQCAHGVSRVHV